jgi:glycosyltransferase involved in cell wall biosynthesis
MKSSGLIYCYVNRSTFVKKEVLLLEESFTVIEFDFSSKNKLGVFILFLKQLILIVKNLSNTDLFVCQFAGYHSFLPGLIARLTGKKMLIVAGGTDCVSFPTIGYGNFNKRFLRLFTIWSYRMAHHIAPKHETLWRYDYTYDTTAVSAQGIQAFLPQLQTPHTSIPNGYDPQFWKCEEPKRIKRRFITVSSGFEYPFQKQLKGIDLILNVAPLFPECEFQIVGVSDVAAFGNVSRNVTLLPPMSAIELRNAYCQSEFYLQLSMAEGFPNALCEAMLCGCVPVGSAVFSIPEIIGKNGFILQQRDIALLEALLKSASSNYSSDMGRAASTSIAERFPISRRKAELSALCLALVRK